MNSLKILSTQQADVYSFMTEQHLTSLESKLEQLIALCNRLEKENQKLREKEAEWQHERARLIEKNDVARTRVEAMITRLKSLEQEG